jgi:uncharacterized membrane protein YeaQ/YmgE (transglycosylase-associated protein family)
MDFATFVTGVVVGLLTGWLAAIVMKDQGHGLLWDLVLGIAGSSAVSVAVWALGSSPDAGRFMMAVIAFVGATLVIVAQCTMWPSLASARPPRRVRPRSRR